MTNKLPRIVQPEKRYTAPGAEGAQTRAFESSETVANMPESVDLSLVSRFTVPGSAEREDFYFNNATPSVPSSELTAQDRARQILVDYEPAQSPAWLDSIDRVHAKGQTKRNKGFMQSLRNLLGN